MDIKNNNESPRRIVAEQQSPTCREIYKSKDQLSSGLKKSSSFQRKKLLSKVPRITRVSNTDCLKPEGIHDKPVLSGDKKAGPSRSIKPSLKHISAHSTKPSHIPRRKISYKSKEVCSEETNKEIHTSQKFHVNPISPRNVQQVQLLINQDLYPENKKHGISIATTRPLPSLDQLYARNDVQNTDRLNNWFVELSNPVPANSRVTSFFHRTCVQPSVNVSEHIRVENKNRTLTVSNVEFNGTNSPSPKKKTEDIISDWLANIDYSAMDNESGYRSVSPESRLPRDIKSKSSFLSGIETTSITGINVHQLSEKNSRKSLDYDNTPDLVNQKVHEVIKKQKTGKKIASPSVKKNMTASDQSKESRRTIKPCIDSVMGVPKAYRKPTSGSTYIKTYKSNPGGDGKKFVPGHSQYLAEYPSSATENVQVTVPSYVDYPSEILQRTTNFEDMAMLASLDKDTSSIAATDREMRDDISCPSMRNNGCTLETRSTECCAQCRVFESEDDGSKTFDEEDYVMNRCSRSRHRHHHRDFRCYTESEQDKRFPSTKYYLPKTLSMLRRRMSMRQCRRGLNRVWKKTAERWAMWSAKSPYRFRKLRVKQYLHRTVIWEDVDVQTSLFVYKEVGTCPVLRMQKSVAVSNIYCQQRAGSLNTRSSVSKPNTIPSIFPFQRSGRSFYSRPKGQERSYRSASTPKSNSPPRREYSFPSSNPQRKKLEILRATTQTSNIELKDDHKKVLESDSYNIVDVTMDDKLIGTEDISTMKDNMTCTSVPNAVVSQLNTELLQNQLLLVNANPGTDDILKMKDNTTCTSLPDALVSELNTGLLQNQLLLVDENPGPGDIFHLKDNVLITTNVNVDAIRQLKMGETDDMSHLHDLSSKLDKSAPVLCMDYENLHKQMLTVSNNPRTDDTLNDNLNSTYLTENVTSQLSANFENIHNQMLTVCDNPQADVISALQGNLSSSYFNANATPDPNADSVNLQKQMLPVCNNPRTDSSSLVKDTVARTSLNAEAVPELSADYENLQTQMLTACNPRKDSISLAKDILVPASLNDNAPSQLSADYKNFQKQMLTVCNNPRFSGTDNFSLVKDIVATTSLNDNAPSQLSADYKNLEKQMLNICNIPRMDNIPLLEDTVDGNSSNVDAVPQLSVDYENLHKQMLTVCNNPQPAIKFPPVAPVQLPTDTSVSTALENVASNKTCETNTDSKQFNSINIMTSHALMKRSNKIRHIETQVTPVQSMTKVSTDIMVSSSFLKNNSSKVDTATDMKEKVINDRDFVVKSTTTPRAELKEAEIQSLKSQMRSGYCLTSVFQINPSKDADPISEETATSDDATIDSSPSRLLTYFNTGMLMNTLMETAIMNSRLKASVSTDTEWDKAIGYKTSDISTSTKSLFIGRDNVMKCQSRVSVDTNTELKDKSISSLSRNEHTRILKRASSAGSRKMDNSKQYSSVARNDSLLHNFKKMNCSHPVALRALRVNNSEVQTDKNWTPGYFVRRDYKCASASTSQCVFYNEAEQGPTNDMVSSIMSKQGKISSIINSGLQTDNASYLDAVKWIKAGIQKANVSQLDVNSSNDEYKTLRFGYDTSASDKASVSKSIKSEFDVKRILEKSSISKLVIPECSPDKKSITTASEHDVKYKPEMNIATKPVAKFAVELPCDLNLNVPSDKKNISIAVGSDSIIIDQDLLNNETTVAAALPRKFENEVDMVPERDITNSPKKIDLVQTDKIDKDVKANTFQSNHLSTDTASACVIPKKKSTSVYTSRYILPIPKPCTCTSKSQQYGYPGECFFVYGVPRCIVHGQKNNADVSCQFSVSRLKPLEIAAQEPGELCDRAPHKRIVGVFTTYEYYNTKTIDQQTSRSLEQIITPKDCTSFSRHNSNNEYARSSGTWTKSRSKELCDKAHNTRAVGIITSNYKTGTRQTTTSIEQGRTTEDSSTTSRSNNDFAHSSGVLTQSSLKELCDRDDHKHAVGIITTYYKTCTQQTKNSLEQLMIPKVYEAVYTTEVLSKEKEKVSAMQDSEKSIQIIEYRELDVATDATDLNEKRSVLIDVAPDMHCTSINTSLRKSPRRSIYYNDQLTQKETVAKLETYTQCNGHPKQVNIKWNSDENLCGQSDQSQEARPEVKSFGTEAACLFGKHSAAIENCPVTQCVSVNTSQFTNSRHSVTTKQIARKGTEAASLFEKHTAAIEACPDMHCVSVNTSLHTNTTHSVTSKQITKRETAIKLTTCTQYSFTKTISKEKGEETSYAPQCTLEEVPPEVKNLSFLSDDHEEDQLASSCRYYSSLLSKQLRRVKEQCRHIYNTLNTYQTTSTTNPDVCVMKPSARLDLACQTSRSRPDSKSSKLICPLSNAPPTITLSNIGQEEKGDLKSVYFMLTAIEGRMRRLKTNLEY